MSNQFEQKAVKKDYDREARTIRAELFREGELHEFDANDFSPGNFKSIQLRGADSMEYSVTYKAVRLSNNNNYWEFSYAVRV